VVDIRRHLCGTTAPAAVCEGACDTGVAAAVAVGSALGSADSLSAKDAEAWCLPPEQWWHGRQVLGQTMFSWQRTQKGNSLLAMFVPKERLLPGVLSISSFGLKTGSPTAGGKREIRIAWLVRVSAVSHRYAGPFPAFDAVGYDYGGNPITDTLKPGVLPAAWIL